jgi:hypothetical protein
VPDRVQRARHADLESVVDRVVDSGGGGAAARLLTTTTVTAYPSVAGSFFACNPTELDGAETEGGAATFTVDATQVIYALNQGTQVPPNGTCIVAHAVGGKWNFRYDG